MMAQYKHKKERKYWCYVYVTAAVYVCLIIDLSLNIIYYLFVCLNQQIEYLSSSLWVISLISLRHLRKTGFLNACHHLVRNLQVFGV